MSSPRFNAIGKIDVNMLVALQITLSERSVGKAAAEIGLSQPAMSNALGRMRAAFDDPLLVRTHGRMELTARGREVLEQLDEILPQLGRLAQPPTFDPARSTDSMNIASNDLAVQLIAPEIVRIFANEAPHAKLTITTLQSREMDREKLDVDYDLRMGWFFSPPPSWYIRKLFEEEMVLIADPAKAFEGQTIGAEEFTSLPHVAMRMHKSLEQSGMDKMLQDRGIARRIAVWMSNFSAIPQVIVGSDLVALVPFSIAQRHERLGTVQILRPPVTLDTLRVSMAWASTVHHDPANRWLRQVVVRAAEAFSGRQLEEETLPEAEEEDLASS